MARSAGDGLPVLGPLARGGGWLAAVSGALLSIAVLLVAMVVPPLTMAGTAVRDTADRLGDVPPLAKVLPRPPTRSTIYAADGSVLATLFLDQDRIIVPLKDVAPVARNAVLAIEDARFYQHQALDYRGIARALVADIRGGTIRQGGSTLTQQYVKNVITGNEVDVDRKIHEAIYAVALEKRMSKDQIFQGYLNEAYFGDGVYGIATAADHYFSTPVNRLSLVQAASLAGAVAAPERYKPTAGKIALVRRNEVLDRMAAVGFISTVTAAKAKRAPIALHISHPTTRFPYFVEYIKHQLLTDHRLDGALGPAGSAERLRSVFQGGLQIHTSLEPKDQGYAEDAVRRQLTGTTLDGATVSLDPRTGAIEAMVAGSNFAKSKVNLATGQGGSRGFPVGSTFKVFYLVSALEQGIPISTTFDTPSPITIPASACHNGTGWTVNNAEGSGLGRINMVTAIADSVNTYFAQLAVRVGAENAIEVAHRMGVTANLFPVCSLVLGPENLPPLDVATAFGTLATGGIHCQPYAITQVKGPDGASLLDATPSCTRVLDPRIALTAVKLLEGVVQHGTGTAANIGRPLAGKTGTTEDYTNAWFTGFTPQLATSVWVGHASGFIAMRTDFHGGHVFGGTFPALIFQQYMAAALTGQPVLDFPLPPPPPLIAVPDVAGLDLTGAAARLQAAGLQASQRLVPSNQPVGTVIGTAPGPGTKVPEGSVVASLVSGGPAPTTTTPTTTTVAGHTVPPVTGLTQARAVKILQAAGFKVAITTVPVPVRALDKKVLAEVPAAGSKAPPGTVVTLMVGKFGP